MKTHSGARAGIAYIVLTAGCFATTDATVKHLAAALPVLVLLWSRYVFQTTVMRLMQATRRGARARRRARTGVRSSAERTHACKGAR
jgi:hypothetical protein